MPRLAASRPHSSARRASCCVGLALLSLGCGVTPPARPDIVLITLDTTRADRLGCYGYERDTSPALDRLGRDAVVHTRAYSTSSWTLPAHASLFTGKFPTTHGARYAPDGEHHLGEAIAMSPTSGVEKVRARILAPDEPTLAQLLANAGYTTAAVVAGPWLKRNFGLARGFGSYDDADLFEVAGRPAARVTDSALAFLDGLETAPRQPFFLFLNFFDPHGPYEDPEGLAAAFLPPGEALHPAPAAASPERARALYDGEIRYMDRHIGRLLDALRERGLYRDAWIVVTADHGELLGEQGRWGHGYELSEAELHVPLLVKRSRGEAEPGHSDAPIQLVDLLPLLLTRVGAPIPEGVQGDAPPERRHPVFAEIYPLRTSHYQGSWRALYRGDLKYLWSDLHSPRLFDLASDPVEQHDLAAQRPAEARELAAALQVLVEALPTAVGAPAGEVDPATRGALEALGYLR